VANPRVHEIASEIGVDSKVALAKLKELGEYVKSPSSTIAPPVARKLRAALEADGSVNPSAGAAPAAGTPGYLVDKKRSSFCALVIVLQVN